MKVFTRSAVVAVVALALLSPTLSRADRPTFPACFANPGVCFADLEGAANVVVFRGDGAGNLIWRAKLAGTAEDFLRFSSDGSAFLHVTERDVLELIYCPAGTGTDCFDLGGSPIPGPAALVGDGSVHFNVTAPRGCPAQIGISGVVSNAAGDEFDLGINEVRVPDNQTGGCRSIIDDIDVEPVLP